MQSVEDILESYARLHWTSSTEAAPHCEMWGRFSNGVMGWSAWSNAPDRDEAMQELIVFLRNDMLRWVIWLEKYRNG